MTLQIHLHMIRKEGFALGNSSCLKIQGFERNLSHYFLFFIIIDLLQLWQFLAADLLYFLGKGHAGSTEMAQFPAAEAKFLFNAAFAFFRGVMRDILLVGRAKPDCLEGGTHEETLHPQVYPRVKCRRFRTDEVLSRLPKDPRIH